MKIYCPYVILNRTGLHIEMAETKGLDIGNHPGSPSSTSRNIFSLPIGECEKSDPLLFSFSSGRSTRHRVRLRTDESNWSEVCLLFLLFVVRLSGCCRHYSRCSYEEPVLEKMVQSQRRSKARSGAIRHGENDTRCSSVCDY